MEYGYVGGVGNSLAVGGGVAMLSMGLRWSVIGRWMGRERGRCVVSAVGRGTGVDGLRTLRYVSMLRESGND